MQARFRNLRHCRPRGQAAVEFLLVLAAVGLAMFVPWRTEGSLAQILRRAIGGFFDATLLALSLV